MPQFTRRQFLYGSAAALGSLSMGQSPLWADRGGRKHLPKPDKSGIDHVVVVMMENRSFDHLLGLAAGRRRQAGRPGLHGRPSGRPSPTYPLAPDYQGCGHPDPDHSYEGGRIEYDDGLCDGWLRAGANDRLCDRLLHASRICRFSGKAAPDWTACDGYFAAIMAATYPNRIYQHAAQTDRLDESARPLDALPTIWDRLRDAGLRRTLLLQRRAVPRAVGREVPADQRTYGEFLADCAAGHAPRGVLRRSAVPRRGRGHLGRRPSARRHPQRRGVPEPVYARWYRARTGSEHRHGDQFRRVGRLLRSRGADPGPIRRRTWTPGISMAARVPRAVRGRLAVVAPRGAVAHGRLRSHLGPEDDRVGAGACRRSPCATPPREIWRRCSTSTSSAAPFRTTSCRRSSRRRARAASNRLSNGARSARTAFVALQQRKSRPDIVSRPETMSRGVFMVSRRRSIESGAAP